MNTKLKSLLIMFICISLSACANKNTTKVTTKLSINTNSKPQQGKINQLKQILKERIENDNFEVISITENINDKSLEVVANINPEKINEYNSLFSAGKFKIVHTYSINSISKNIKIDSLYSNDFYYGDFGSNRMYSDIIGYVTDSTKTKKIVSQLQKKFNMFPHLKLLPAKSTTSMPTAIHMINNRKDKNQISNNEIDNVTNDFEKFNPTYSNLNIQFNERGTKIFHEMTKEALSSKNKNLAICIDGKVMSSPTVMQEMSNGYCQVSGNFTKKEAEQLSKKLNLKALPYNLTIVEQSTEPTK